MYVSIKIPIIPEYNPTKPTPDMTHRDESDHMTILFKLEVYKELHIHIRN